ncbi:MAG: hypothetical protein ACLR0N_06500 [Bilophila wadsworthia]
MCPRKTMPGPASLVGTGGKHVAELLIQLVGVDGGLGDLSVWNPASRIQRKRFPRPCSRPPPSSEGIHVYQPLDHAPDLRLAPVKVGIEFPGRALQFMKGSFSG